MAADRRRAIGSQPLLFSVLALVFNLLSGPGAPAPAGAASHLQIVSGNGGVSDDPAFPAAWDQLAGGVNSCRIDRDAPDAVYTSSEGLQYYYGVFPVRRAGLLYFDVAGIPTGRRILSARLHVKTWWVGMSPNPARPDSLFACADTSASDARWVGANQATWSEPREGESGPWTPELASRANYRQFGIVSRPWVTPVAAGQNQPGVGWWSLDVTRGVQAWVNGSPNAGFWLFGRAWYDKNASLYWSQAANPALRPWLEITWDDEPYAGPWPGGRQVAFSFSTDDGFKPDNLAWASALDSLGFHFTVAVVDSFIKVSTPGYGEKLNDSDLAGLAAAGHDVASHTVSHREWNPLTVPDSVVAWGVERDSISMHVGPGYEVRSIAWPFHLHDRRMLEIARDEGYLVGRNGGLDWATLKRGQLCSWDSCRIYEVGLTMADAALIADEAATRLYVRNSVTEGIEHGNCWINLYTHTTDGRYSGGNGVSRQELVWAIDELKRTGVAWIGSMAEVATYYRQTHVPSPEDPLLWVLEQYAPPGAVADLTAGPGTGTVQLSWVPPTIDVAGLEVWRSHWRGPDGGSAYPLYDDLAGAWLPPAPTSRAAAAADSVWVLVATLPAAAVALEDTVIARGIYEYTVFARDSAGNFGPPPSAPGIATNYHLGDTPSPGDGVVSSGDLDRLGAAYGCSRGSGGFAPECDFGPTGNAAGTGIPLPDGVIDFEDYMIVAQNYSVPAPNPDPVVAGPVPVLVALSWIDERTVALGLLSPHEDLKGLHLVSALSPDDAPTVSLSPRAEKTAASLSALNDRGHGLDLGVVALGAGFGWPAAGEFCRLVFPRPVTLDAVTVEGRDLANQPLSCVIVQVTGIPERHVAALGQNSPNPFNPSTVIPFVLPRAGRARLDVYGLDGRHVATLVDGELPAGAHGMVWSGGDDRGRAVASGIYLLALRFDDVRLTRRMTLVK